MQLPQQLLESLKNAEGFSKETFEEVHLSGRQITSIRINPAKVAGVSDINSLIRNEPVSWSGYGYYLEARPSFTFDPLFHAGCYYVQEASSMFLEQAIKQTVDLSKPVKVLDLCAAPGGKSTHIQSLISKESLLVSNEVIRSRANVLKDNIIKWGCSNVVVTNNDPKDFSRLENYFDVIVIDAPCSGSGLFRKDTDAISEWSENNVQLCSQRQQRILADVWPALKKGGILIYSTCSYSKEEDEDIMDWITREQTAINCKLKIESDGGITTSTSLQGNLGYRFWPDKVRGEGFFLTCFQKTGGEMQSGFNTKKKLGFATKKETAIISRWMSTDNNFIKHINTVYAWPLQLTADFSFLLEKLRVIYSGTLIGELMRDKLVPDHALAMSNLLHNTVPKTELSEEESIQYLQRKDFKKIIDNKGWQIVSFQGNPLGWINVLPNRINNYYPKELRILKER